MEGGVTGLMKKGRGSADNKIVIVLLYSSPCPMEGSGTVGSALGEGGCHYLTTSMEVSFSCAFVGSLSCVIDVTLIS